jgi:hypothetical protein
MAENDDLDEDFAAVPNDLDLETTFDDLRRRHELVCGLVSCCQDCFLHLAPAVYAFGIVIVCFIIFLLSSGYIVSGDLPSMGTTLYGAILSMIVTTVIGSVLHNSVSILLQKSMRYRSMRLLQSRVRHVTFSQASRAMLNLLCLQHSLQAA